MASSALPTALPRELGEVWAPVTSFTEWESYHQPLTGPCGATELGLKSPQWQMAFKEHIQLHVCVTKGRSPRGKCRGEKETVPTALKQNMFKMGKRHGSGSLNRTAVLRGVSSVCSHRSSWGPKVIPHDSWLQGTITISKWLGSINPQKQRFSLLARGRKEAGRLGSEGRSKDVPAHTGSREMSWWRCWKAQLALP